MRFNCQVFQRSNLGTMVRSIVPILACLFLSCQKPTQPPRGLIQELWFAPQPAGFVRSRPAITNDVVIFGAGDGSVIAHDTGTGAIRWKTVVFGQGQLGGAEIVVGANVVVAEGIREVAALNV